MALFLFHLRDEQGILHDVGQLELADLDAAAGEASATLGEMAKDQLRTPAKMELTMEVRDEENKLTVVASIRFDLTIFPSSENSP